MSWQSGSINPATTSPLADISRIKNDLSVLKGVLGGTQDADVPFTPYAWPAARITGDFSNATLSNRVMFQTSTVNGATGVYSIPNGTNTGAQIGVTNSSDANNAAYLDLAITNTEARVRAVTAGSGTYLPMTFYTGGAERMRIDTSGNVGIGGTPVAKLHSYGSMRLQQDSGSIGFVSAGGVKSWYVGANISDTIDDGLHIGSGIGVGGTLYIHVTSAGVQVRQPVGLGYGPGAGGTVTQSTSKSTTVTLNKPCGQITMNNAALAAGGLATFTFNNSLIAAGDIVLVCVGQSGIANPDAYLVRSRTSTGACAISLVNQTGGSLSEAVVVNFAIIRGSAS